MAEKSDFPAGQQSVALYIYKKMPHNNVKKINCKTTETLAWYPPFTGACFTGYKRNKNTWCNLPDIFELWKKKITQGEKGSCKNTRPLHCDTEVWECA